MVRSLVLHPFILLLVICILTIAIIGLNLSLFFYVVLVLLILVCLFFVDPKELTSAILGKISSANIENLFEQIPEGIIVVNAKGNIIYCNEKAAKIFGYSLHDFKSIKFSQLFSSKNGIQQQWLNQNVFSKSIHSFSEPFESSYIGKTKNGTKFNLELTLNKFNYQNKSLAIFCIKDITKKKVKELKHKEIATQLTEISSSIPGALFQIKKNQNGKYYLPYASSGLYMLLNISKKEIEENIDILFSKIHQDDAKEVLTSLETSSIELTPWFKIFRIYKSDQSIAWIRVKSTPKLNYNNEITWNGFFYDISDLILTEEKLTKSNLELTKANKELDRFVYSTSHDLRSPLTSILGLVSFIEEDSNEPDTLLHVSLIKESIIKLDNTIKEIHHYAKNKRTDLTIDKINFNTMVNNTINGLKFIDEAKNMRFITEINQAGDFYSDENRLLKCLENLIGNAIKYSNPVNANNWIKITANIQNTNALIVIEDNGIGIEEKYLPNLFNMFFRVSSTKTGSGLGLFIVEETIHKIGGNIKVASKLGQGTIFTLNIPNQVNSN